MACRWTFYDPYSLVTATFEVNPKEGGSPQQKKNITKKPTTAPNGVTLLFEGAREPDTIEWSGVLLNQDQYDMFYLWWTKRHQIKLTDDLSRERYIYITEFVPQRERARHLPWKHSYTMRAVVLDWP